VSVFCLSEKSHIRFVHSIFKNETLKSRSISIRYIYINKNTQNIPGEPNHGGVGIISDAEEMPLCILG
jgi:hypothetical protein